ncbi:MAG: family 43 glycosylhydrolase [Bacteroidota bacterium]
MNPILMNGKNNRNSELVKTYCNPVGISYRFCLDKPSRREAADPTVILFKDEYFLFASKSGGYWHSKDLINWNLIETGDLPTEEYAPTAVVMDDTVFFMASGEKSPIYKTNDPKTGRWEVVNPGFPFSVTDPDLFYDDGRLYLYYGCSNKEPLYCVELDLNNKLEPIGIPVKLFGVNTEIHGWERQGDFNELTLAPWLEGAWMNKHNGLYYLQYAAPGTEFKTYADGVYTSRNLFGPFEYQKSNPFSLKQGGFLCGAGHGSTFEDKNGNLWHITTQTISVKHIFERRIGIFPAGFDDDGVMFTKTAWGDYPQYMYDEKRNQLESAFTGWMLLSYKKKAWASSEIDLLPVMNAFDEDIRTYWSAKSGNKGEWLSVDLGEESTVNALQINFAEHETNLYGRSDKIYYQYTIEYSTDGKIWRLLVDKSENKIDMPHDYIELDSPVRARYLKLNNIHVPDGKFAVSGFRIFGKGYKHKPKVVDEFEIVRNELDKCNVEIKWNEDKLATGFVINYGAGQKKLYHSLMVYGSNSVTLKSLNSDYDYYFSIDSFNEGGITKGIIIKVAGK